MIAEKRETSTGPYGSCAALLNILNILKFLDEFSFVYMNLVWFILVVFGKVWLVMVWFGWFWFVWFSLVLLVLFFLCWISLVL